MTNNKKPVILVALVLIVLMVLPMIVLMVSKGSGPVAKGGPRISIPKGDNTSEAVNYDLRQLAERAEKLLSEDLADALRKGDVSLDFIAALNKDAEKARDALADGKLEKAEQYYSSTKVEIENRLNGEYLVPVQEIYEEEIEELNENEDE